MRIIIRIRRVGRAIVVASAVVVGCRRRGELVGVRIRISLAVTKSRSSDGGDSGHRQSSTVAPRRNEGGRG